MVFLYTDLKTNKKVRKIFSDTPHPKTTFHHHHITPSKHTPAKHPQSHSSQLHFLPFYIIPTPLHHFSTAHTPSKSLLQSPLLHTLVHNSHSNRPTHRKFHPRYRLQKVTTIYPLHTPPSFQPTNLFLYKYPITHQIPTPH